MVRIGPPKLPKFPARYSRRRPATCNGRRAGNIVIILVQDQPLTYSS